MGYAPFLHPRSGTLPGQIEGVIELAIATVRPLNERLDGEQ